MRWTIFIAILAISCTSVPAPQSPESIARETTPCPLLPELSGAEQRKTLILPIAKNMDAEQKKQLVELLKLWGTDAAKLLGYTEQLKIKAGCEGYGPSVGGDDG